MSVFLIDLPDYAPEEEQRVYMGDGSGGYVLAFPLLSAQRRMAFNIKKLPWPPIESTKTICHPYFTYLSQKSRG